MHDVFQKRTNDLEVLGNYETRPDFLHAEHEDWKEGVFDFSVIWMFESLLANLE